MAIGNERQILTIDYNINQQQCLAVTGDSKLL